MDINEEMTIGDLVKSGVYGQFADYIFTYMTPDHWKLKLKEYGFEKVGFLPALRRMEELEKTGKNFVYDIYPEETNLSEWDKAYAKFLHFPGPVSGSPYAVVIPGGGFSRQWGLIEGLAIAAKLNELGYTAFVLFYRTKQEPLMPKPLEDMYGCIRYIEEHAEEFAVHAGQYCIGGFSAGATIAGEIGSSNLGWKNAGVPKPEMIFMGYTAVQMDVFYKMYTDHSKGHPLHDGIAPFLRRVGGPEFTLADIEPYNLTHYMDQSYPPVYITANEDDETVPVENSRMMVKTCEEIGIPCKSRFGSTGGHSYGLGIGLEVEGWLEEAVSFWKQCADRK